MPDPEQAPRVLTGHKMPVYDLDLSADGELLLSVGYKDPVYAWSMKSPGNRPDALIKAVDESIGKYPTLAVTVSPDGKFVATADVLGQVRLWAAPEFDEPYATFMTGSQYDIMTLAFSPDGRYLAAGQGDASVHLWDLAPETVEPAPPLDENEASAGLSAGEILTRSSEALGDLQTMTMTVTVDYRPDESAPGEEAGEQRILTQTVTYRFPDEKHMATNYSDVLRIEEVQLPDGTIYGRDAGKGEWHKVTAIFFPALESLRQPETLARSAHLSGTETLDGVETYVVTFDVRPQELLRILDVEMLNQSLGTSRSSATGTVWIGQEDFLARRVAYEVRHVTPWVDNGARVVVDLGGFDEPVEMPSPVD